MMDEGAGIAEAVDAELGVTLRLFVAGGRAALDGIAMQGYDVLSKRPSVSKGTKAMLMVKALGWKAGAMFGRGAARR